MTQSALHDDTGAGPAHDRLLSDIAVACRVLASESNGLAQLSAALRVGGADPAADSGG
ncbi:hypothetical protein HUK84_16890, partial [Nguyenibacter vanlangensis]|nr:hypothetical protein [Nguyenibacter vanlangensis]